MTGFSLPAAPAVAADWPDEGEREQPWGRITGEVDDVHHVVTSPLPSPEEPLRREATVTAEVANRLAALRVVGEWPPPAEPARLARPGELPALVTSFRRAVVEPWISRAYVAPSGSVPYTWQRRAAGYLATPIAYLRLSHPDGRRAVAVWIKDSIAERGPKDAKVWGLHWSYAEGWRWRVAPYGSFPAPIGARALKAAVSDPTWRETPYLIESETA